MKLDKDRQALTIKRARELRRRMTLPEVKLWEALRRKQFLGFRFRRQAPIGPYIADFACFKPKLIVEVDGSCHENDEAYAHDLRRDAWLKSLGFEVMRLAASDVLNELDATLDGVEAKLKCTRN